MNTVTRVWLTAAIMGSVAASGFAVAEYGAGKGGDGEGRQGGKHMYHHGGMYGGKAGPERWLGHMAEKLELNEAQKAEVKGILEAAKADAQPLRERMRANMKAEREAFESGADEVALKKLARETADTRVELMVHGQALEQKVRAVLTAEQNAELDAHKAKRKAQMEARMEKWRSGKGAAAE